MNATDEVIVNGGLRTTWGDFLADNSDTIDAGYASEIAADLARTGIHDMGTWSVALPS